MQLTSVFFINVLLSSPFVLARPTPQSTGQTSPTTHVASGFTDPNLGGKKVDFTAKQVPTGCQNIELAFNDALSSLEVTDKSIKCDFFTDNNCAGLSMTVTGAQGPVKDLSVIPAGGLYNKSLSSYSCVKA
ncbi:hypothetical protein DL96DRAFT_1619991, partial [Flagelloscypha sp. PMI_526]